MTLRVLLLVSTLGLLWSQTSSTGITFERILNASREPQNWLTYSGNTSGQRHSLLTQITAQAVPSGARKSPRQPRGMPSPTLR